MWWELSPATKLSHRGLGCYSSPRRSCCFAHSPGEVAAALRRTDRSQKPNHHTVHSVPVHVIMHESQQIQVESKGVRSNGLSRWSRMSTPWSVGVLRGARQCRSATWRSLTSPFFLIRIVEVVALGGTSRTASWSGIRVRWRFRT